MTDAWSQLGIDDPWDKGFWQTPRRLSSCAQPKC